MRDGRPTAARYPDARYVGPHLVVDRTEWVPGVDPESHLRADGQTEYVETYLRCLRCGAERLNERDFPDECDAAGTVDR